METRTRIPAVTADAIVGLRLALHTLGLLMDRAEGQGMDPLDPRAGMVTMAETDRLHAAIRAAETWADDAWHALGSPD